MAAKIHNSSTVTINSIEYPQVPTQLYWTDKVGAFKARIGFGRMNYTVKPGIYTVGNPDENSPVLISANYKLSFDALRKELTSLNAWIIVIDTKGINVWCAAGKGTFGTDEIVRRINLVELAKIVSHRKIIVPQLGAVGVSAHKVKKLSGFSVIYGPVRAKDIIEFMQSGMQAAEKMRQIHFSLYDRLILTPIEFVVGGKYMLVAMLLFFILAGLNKNGYSTDLTVKNGLRSAINLFAAFFCGAVIGPALLPWLPGRSFAFKGLSIGLTAAAILSFSKMTGNTFEIIAWFLLFSSIASFFTMNFTGASTYTSLSGVKKEMRLAVPLQLIAAIAGAGLWITSRFV